jgi:uncharacterized protein
MSIKNVSDEMINAYIDNELDPKDTQFIDVQMKNDAVLQHRIEQLQELKVKIRNSYASVHPPVQEQSKVNCKNYLIPAGIAASIALVIGLTTGWYTHGSININTADSSYLLGVKLEDLKPQDNKIIIHLAQNDISLFDRALTKAETLLAHFDTLHQQGKVHILANAYGIDLLRSGKTPYQERIIKMMKKYDNVEFVACENTIKRLKSSGKNIDLLPGVKVNGPVINEIISGLQNGWTYISI